MRMCTSGQRRQGPSDNVGSMKYRSQMRSMALIVAVLGAMASGACASKSINHILADPSRYQNREVQVSGTVAESFSVADRGVYRIADQSSGLWVIAKGGVPRKGARVTVKGTIRDGFNLGSLGEFINLPAGIESGLVLMESSHKAD